MKKNKQDVIAVTGGAGLIGSFLVDILVSQNKMVRVIDDFSKGTRNNLKKSIESVEVFEGNLEDKEFAKYSLEGCHEVYHLASRAYGVGYSKGRNLEILFHNEKITNNFFEALQIYKPKKILITSSSCVYDDNGPETVSEIDTFVGNPENVNKGYGWAKRFLEQKSKMFDEENNIPVTIVRPFNIYGERYSWVGEFSQAIPMLVKKIMDDQNPLEIWGSGNQRRSYIHAHDCARIMQNLVHKSFSNGPVNIGTESTISITELVELICKICKKNPDLKFNTSMPEGRFIKSSNNTKFFSIIPKFKYEISFNEGIMRMIEWYKENFAK